MKHLFLAAALVASPAIAQISVEGAWMRATPPGAKTAAGYATIRNTSASADRLVSVSSPAAERVETHTTVREGEISRMRETKGYVVPAKGSLELKPGGSHLMFVNIKAPLKAGQTVDALLKFERAGEMKLRFEVRPLGASSGEAAHDQMHMR
jgi:copper(I)-binding protein